LATDATFVIFALFVLVGSTVQSLTGFGGIIIALTLGALLYPIHELLPVLAPMSLAVTGTILVRYGARADLRLFFGLVLPVVGVGFAAGVTLFASVEIPWAERAYGALVLLFAGMELARALRSPGAARSEDPRPDRGPRSVARLAPWMLVAGLAQGMYASGGPVLVDERRFGIVVYAVLAFAAATLLVGR